VRGWVAERLRIPDIVSLCLGWLKGGGETILLLLHIYHSLVKFCFEEGVSLIPSR
jgi:hypothetical protein